MRIAMTSQNFSTITSHAGRARRFLLFEIGADGIRTDAGRLDLAPEYAIHGYDEAKPHPLDGVNVLLTGSAGEGFFRKAARRGIRVICTAEKDPTRALDDFVNGSLAPAEPHDHDDCCGH